jgi:restriction system protein
MAVPDFQSAMLLLLTFCADGKEHTNREALDALAQELSLSEDDQKALLPSGQQCIFDNRVAWARAHIKMAGLLENTRDGVFRTTERGQEVLGKKPSEFNLRFLRQFLSTRQPAESIRKTGRHPPRRGQKTRSARPRQRDWRSIPDTPRESCKRDSLPIEVGFTDLFEKVVVEVLVKMGYGGSRKDAGQAIGRSGDEGIDGIIKEDRLGLDIIYIQAKKWEDPISRPEIQKFAGALQGKRARKGIFITTSRFCDTAKVFAANIDSKIILMDGQQLAQYMIDFGVGVATDAVYEVKRLDSDYFTDN